jgi:hypothetical protein
LTNEEVYGNPIPGHVYISSADNVLTLIMTEETATADCPSHELVTLLAETCGIKDQKHISLLFTALSNLSLKKTNAAFLQQGIKVEGLILGTSNYARSGSPTKTLRVRLLTRRNRGTQSHGPLPPRSSRYQRRAHALSLQRKIRA